MKRLFAVILCICLFPVIPLSSLAEENAPPQIGDIESGFRVLSVEPVPVLGATGVLFEHEKSGAKLLYYASADINRSFQISFRTPALDDKGKPHVFEHITISGSSKYPDANLFFPFSNQTYSTYVNAGTYHGMTTFPLASLSEEQLMTMMDYYLSGVFTPLLYDEPRLKEREAWRYELSDRDAPLTVAGTVFSEMQGAMTIQRHASHNDMRTLFHDSPVAHVSGGLPDAIRTLSYEELIAFHDTYYHPSNALIILYGDLDWNHILGYLDTEYLSAYDRRDVYVEMGRVEPYTETRYETYEVAVEQGAQTEDASYIYYSFALDGANLHDMICANVLTSLLNTETLPFMRAAREKLPKASVYASTQFDTPLPQISFVATGVNEADRDTFVGIVDDAIAQLAADGIPKDELDALLSINKLSLRLTAENTSLGISAGSTTALCWAYFDDISYYNTYENVLSSIDQQRLDSMVQTMLADNRYRAVSVTKPVAGLAEENEKAFSDELAQAKAAMTDEELDALVAQYADFTAWSGAEPSEELVSRLVNMSVEKLPEEMQHYDIADETVNGVRYLTAQADIADVGQISILLDASGLPINSIHDAQICQMLLGELDTKAHTREELDTLIVRYLPGFGTSLGASNGYGDVADMYNVSFSWLGLTEDADKAFELAREILYDTTFDDTEYIHSFLTRERTAVRDSLDQNSLSIQMSRLSAMLTDTAAFGEYSSGKLYYDYLTEMLTLLETNPEAFEARMEAARELLLNKNGATALIAGAQDIVEAYRAAVPGLLEGMKDEACEKVDYSPLRLDASNEILINNMTVHMNIIVANSQAYTGKHPVFSSLINDMYLMPQLRNMNGAYGAYASFGRQLSIFYTFRDPNCAESFEIISALPEYLRTTALTQETVDRYIIGTYSGLSMPQGVLSGALSALSNYLIGMDADMQLTLQREAKATTVADIRAFADEVDTLLAGGMRSTSGAASFAGEVAELFDSVVRYDEESATDENAEDDAA